MTDYERHAHRVQTAIAALMAYGSARSTEPKHLRVGIDTARADQGGLATLLIAKGIFTESEYISALTVAMKQEADSYERLVQSVLSNRNIVTK